MLCSFKITLGARENGSLREVVDYGYNQHNISPKLYRSTNNYYFIELLSLLVKIRQIDKAVAIKTNSFLVLQHVLCFVNALMHERYCTGIKQCAPC